MATVPAGHVRQLLLREAGSGEVSAHITVRSPSSKRQAASAHWAPQGPRSVTWVLLPLLAATLLLGLRLRDGE